MTTYRLIVGGEAVDHRFVTAVINEVLAPASFAQSTHLGSVPSPQHLAEPTALK